MTYATRTDLEERYGAAELTQRESMLATGAVVQALADADAEINSYLSGRYAVPLSPVPDNLPRIACAMARYYLLGSSADDIARNAYKDAIAWLKDVQAGRALLLSAPLAGATQAATVEIATRDKVFKGGLR
jgi:phage gp36-like protein